VYIQSAHGLEKFVGNGELLFEWDGRLSSESAHVDVHGGSFALATAQESTSLRVLSGRMGGQEAYPVAAGAVSSDDSDNLVVVLTIRHLVELDVRSERTGVRPPGIRLYEAPHESYYSSRKPLFPVPRAAGLVPLAVTESGSLYVAPPRFGRCILVKAPGHCWIRLAPDDFAQGLVELVLPLACALRVDVDNAPGKPELHVQLRFPRIRSGSKHYEGLTVGKGQTVIFKAIPPGEYSVTLGPSPGICVASCQVDLAAGEQEAVRLAWSDPKPAAMPIFQLWFDSEFQDASSAVVIVEPQSWSGGSARAGAVLSGAQLEASVVDGSVVVETNRLVIPPGEYSVALDGSGFVAFVDVPSGESEIPILIPVRETRTLRVVDSETGLRVPIRLASWVHLAGRHLDDYYVPPGSGSMFSPDGADEVMMEVPSGTLGVDVSTVTHGRAWFVVDVGAKDRVVELEMKSRVTVRARLSMGNGDLSVESDWVERIEVFDAHGQQVLPVDTAVMGVGGPFGANEGHLIFDAEGPVTLKAPGTPMLPYIREMELQVIRGKEYTVVFGPAD